MSITVLEARSIADRCYLIEALYWLAFQRFPLVAPVAPELDERQDVENIEGLAPSLPWDMLVTDTECERAGLPPNPEYEDAVADDYHQDPKHIRELLKLVGLREADRAKLEADLEASIAFYDRVSRFKAALDAYLDVFKSKLFVGLREGALGAVGVPLPKPTIKRSIAELERTIWDGWLSSGWQPIAPHEWASLKIDWDECTLEASKRAYAHILVDCEAMFSAFPIPLGEPAAGVVKVGDSYVLHEASAPSVSGSTRRGRPPFDWDSFHVEISKRLHQRQVPGKREAFVADMQAWCKAEWKREVGRSTVLQKLKLYDGLIRAMSEKSE